MTTEQKIESALSHHRAGRLAEAEAIYRQILARQPDHADALHLFGILANQIGRSDAAVELIGRAIQLNPDLAEAHVNLGNALANLGKSDQAIISYRHAIRLKPDLAEAHNNLGNALRERRQFDEAIAALREAIRHKPDYAEAHYNLGNALKDIGHFDEAIASYRQAIRIKPDLAEAYSNIGGALQDTGQIDEAIVSFREAIRLKPDFFGVHSNLLLAMNYQADCDAGKLLVEHRAWSDRHADSLISEITSHANDRSPDRRLRIGYVSADFWRHSVGYFFLPLLEHHDPRVVEVYCYANVRNPDDVSERIKRSCGVWRNIVGLADDAIAEMVRSDEIDILVDLSGHTSGNRLLIFARKPAPIQVTYLGYANTTGMMGIDYRLTDAVADPPGMTDHLNVEKLWRLPGCAWCYQPAEDAPDVQPRENAPITFGCFNAFAKINDKLTAIWAELLNRVPRSRLLLKSAGAGEVSSRRRLISQFTEHAIAGERIEMLGRISEMRRHLELYRRVDVALDTYPYHGTTTTCEALWMGIPVISLAGQTHVSRVGVSLLSCAGLPELIAQSPEEYVSIASELAAHPSRLDTLRGSLRNKLKSSPLVDGAKFARDVEDAYRQMWRNWCAPSNASKT